MAPTRTLADSLWPRSAGDAGNRRVFAADGPTQPRLSPPLELPRSPSDLHVVSGGVLGDDGDLRLVHGDFLSRVTLAGAVRWSLSLRAIELELTPPPEPDEDDDPPPGEDAEDEDEERVSHSLPTALRGGRTLITVRHAALIVDPDGRVEDRWLSWEHLCCGPDDSGISPNVTHAGAPIITTPGGEWIVWEEPTARVLSAGAYDILPPALFADGSLALACYAGDGLCRVRPSGERLWRAGPRDADLLPTVNRAQVCAVGSLNDECSLLLSPEGRPKGEHPVPAVFAEYHDMGWIAVGERQVARLDPRGASMWTADLAHGLRWGVYGAIVDRQGRVYVQDDGALLGLDPRGRRLFELRLGDVAGAVFPVADGVFGVVVDGELRFIR
ncbi:hypothetical protein [Nannocystis punicea]|uniref:Uncharacterized protein n=1 Tax=Nannocystis punicea TaxID=2995304 RepID=A0ABY7HC88_9BACT|nr:hypothetical protein [Nannocystis poenicansa]WAS96710.1 hypothetical protein O0S08_11215 [Nannocystis poenicansa]